MRLAVIVGAALFGVAGLAPGLVRASECGEQIRLLDDRYSLAIEHPAEAQAGTRPMPGADQSTASGSSGAAASTAGLDTVPNTGGLANPRNTPVAPLDAARRDQMRAALMDARRADQAGDGTTCAAKVGEARRVIPGQGGDPHAR